jgi:hypothetical protein
MAETRYFELLLSVSHRPAMYGVQDVVDLAAFLTGFGLGSNEPELQQLLGRFTDFLKKENPEYHGSTCGWSQIIKAQSYERGGSIELFRRSLGRMLVEEGHWTDEHFDLFTTKGSVTSEELRSLPVP